MSKIVKYIKDLWKTENKESGVSSSRSSVPTQVTDTRDAATRKRVNKAFDEQWAQMQARAFQAHEPGCDPLTCTKSICFKWEADKIVSKPTTIKAGGSKELSQWANDNKQEHVRFWENQNDKNR